MWIGSIICLPLLIYGLWTGRMPGAYREMGLKFVSYSRKSQPAGYWSMAGIYVFLSLLTIIQSYFPVIGDGIWNAVLIAISALLIYAFATGTINGKKQDTEDDSSAINQTRSIADIGTAHHTAARLKSYLRRLFYPSLFWASFGMVAGILAKPALMNLLPLGAPGWLATIPASALILGFGIAVLLDWVRDHRHRG